MSIEKALKSKNSGVFVENLQAAFLKRSPAEILDAIGKAPALKWSAETEIKKLGLMAWSDNQHLAELVSKIRHCMDSKEYRSAGIGCLYLFGAGKSEDAIELSEKAFESIESSADYEFHATSLLSVLISSAVEWEGAPSGKFFVHVDKKYLGSTISSVAQDLSASGALNSENYIVEFSTGLARAGMHEKATALMNAYLATVKDFSAVESFIYNLTPTVDGIPSAPRTTEATEAKFVTAEFVAGCLVKAKSCAKKSDASSLAELTEYVSDF